MSETLFWTILFLPLTAFAVAGLVAIEPHLPGGGKPRINWPAWAHHPRFDVVCGPRLASSALIIALFIAFILSLAALIDVASGGGLPIGFPAHELFSAGPLTVELGARIDGLSAVMLVVVTGVSLLVQIYSTGYMNGDHGYARYFVFMALFTTSMLGLVLADNLLMLFAFWELVGLTSYLLIGFWFHKPSAAAAAKKAFLVTRLGDLGLLAAMILIWDRAGTLNIAEINGNVEAWIAAGMVAQTAITLFALGLIAGAIGKSAQFPLHIWLPDAMEGPTPVSALVHSATMVAAGVYLLARFFPVVEASSTASDFIAWIGASTAVGAAVLALVQTDIKRVLAYSTISQLAYMMFAIGVGGYAAAVFHLFTHAIFKALLFLGSGSVNHSTNTFDMRRMGGLRALMPITFATFAIGTLSLAGIVPFSGFWSKDEILIEAWDRNGAIFAFGLIAAGLTAAYMVRAVHMTFLGKYQGGEQPEPGGHGGDPAHPHESPRSMTAPLVVLAVVSVPIGFLTFGGEFQTWVYGALPDPHEGKFHWNWAVFLLSTFLAVGAGGAAWLFMQHRERIRELGIGKVWPIPELQRFAVNLFYLDALAENLLARRLFYRGIARAAADFDAAVVDGAVNHAWRGTLAASGLARVVQNGWVQAGALAIMIGGLIIWAATALF